MTYKLWNDRKHFQLIKLGSGRRQWKLVFPPVVLNSYQWSATVKINKMKKDKPIKNHNTTSTDKSKHEFPAIENKLLECARKGKLSLR